MDIVVFQQSESHQSVQWDSADHLDRVWVFRRRKTTVQVFALQDT